jgi:hypothetical protein
MIAYRLPDDKVVKEILIESENWVGPLQGAGF